MPTVEERFRQWNRGMIAFDLALGSGTLLAPRQTLAVIGHRRPTPDAEALFRRCGPIWLTYAAAHAVAARRGTGGDWRALAWLRGAEIATDVVWARSSPGFTRPGARLGMYLAGAGNAAMTLGFGRLARRSRP